jgi:tRNA G18 (ribose-2'-O)-methylase SpoU
MLSDVRSHHNVGSVFRTADAFLIDKIWLTGITPCPPHRDIRKTALGAEETVPFEYITDAVDCCLQLRNQGYKIIAVEQAESSVQLHQVEWDKTCPILLILGNEVTGVADDLMTLADMAVEIPQSGTKRSLNVSVCAGAVLWDAYRAYHIK